MDFSEQTRKFIRQAWQVRKENFAREIRFDYPVKTLSISVTGSVCALNCAHCGGHYLMKMFPIQALTDKNTALGSFKSALISGGCTLDGKVPFASHLEVLKEIKRKTGIRLNFHTGLIEETEVHLLAGLADIVSFDFVADQETIREVYGLKRTPKDYMRTYLALRQVVPVMPHLTIGSKGGEWGGEEQALENLAEMGLDGLTFLVFMPTAGTRYADRHPPDLEELVRFLTRARLRFPHIPLALGCMRPGGQYRQRLDEAAVALGLNRVVIPAPKARELTARLGLVVKRGEECCAL